MNTADRSIALVDSALRRRFYFAGFLPTRASRSSPCSSSWLEANGLHPNAAALLEALNDAIEDEDFSIGPSYFMTARRQRLPTSSGSGSTRSCRCSRSTSTGPTEDLEAEFELDRAPPSASKPMRIDLTAWSEQVEDLPAEVRDRAHAIRHQ